MAVLPPGCRSEVRSARLALVARLCQDPWHDLKSVCALADFFANLQAPPVHQRRGTMAPETKKTSPNTFEKTVELSDKVVQDSTKAAERVAELNEKSAERARRAGAAYLESHDKAVFAFTSSYEKAAGATKVEWIEVVASLRPTSSARSRRRRRLRRASSSRSPLV